MHLWWVTTFPNSAWETYALESLLSLTKCLPQQFKLCIGLDDAVLLPMVKKLLQQGGDGGDLNHSSSAENHAATKDDEKLTSHPRAWDVKAGWSPDHQEFVTRYKSRDHATDYRLQATRFAHKVFVLKHFLDAALKTSPRPDYLVWWDADAILTRTVNADEIAALMPGADEACSYLGRKDWDHSECGFMAFNLANGGAEAILNFMHHYYTEGLVFSLPQWHDSYLFDVARADRPCRNLSAGVPGNNVWAGTPLACFSEHRKGVLAKQRKKALTDAELFGKNNE